jgi:hypothetical protein
MAGANDLRLKGLAPIAWLAIVAREEPSVPVHCERRPETALDQLASAAAVINDDDARATISGAMRRLLRHHRGCPEAEWAIPEAELVPAVALYPALQPHDLIKSQCARTLWPSSSQLPREHDLANRDEAATKGLP